MIESGPMSYSVDVAENFQQTFDNFSETYQEVVDRRANSEVGTTRDPLGIRGRYLKIRLHESGVFADTPLVGKYPIYGAEEITVIGGLLYSPDLSIDYHQRTIELPAGLTADELRIRLRTVGNGGIEILDASGEPLRELQGIPPGSLIIVRDSDTKIAERYTVK